MTFRLSHLALLLAVTIVVTAIGGVTATYRIADEEFRDVLDEDLEIQSEFLAEFFADRKRLPSGSDLQELLEDAFEPDEDEDTRWVSIYDTRSGLRVSNLPHDLPLASTDDGDLELQFDGYTWRGYQAEEDDIVVQILRREDLFDEVRKDILEHIVTPAVTGGVINLLLLGILISFFTWPLTRLVRQLETRSADSLAPIEMRTPAREVIVLRDALNRMMSGVDAVLQRERGFANDVAHELRTPLTTLKLELANAEPDTRAIREEVDRLSRLVQQLLTLARLEQGQWRRQFEEVELKPLFGRVLERFHEKFADADMTLHSELCEATMEGDATLLDILLQNLLNNILNHCPVGTVAEVRLERVAPKQPGLEGQSGEELRLRVSDTGPGISPDLRRQMSRGFMRLDSKSEGFGLGLAICQKIAEVHGATLRFLSREDGVPGLVIEVVFPH
ncbi:MAG TPA: ATP-binding protein [Woeseiaceae bacterium]|nr:ATP-binding protein [Woeseiaceae bacterium]